MSAYGGRGNANPGIAGNRPAIPREDVKLDELEPDLKALIQNRMQKRGLTMDDKCCLCGDIRRDHKLRECGFLWSLTKSGRERILQRRAEQLTGKADPGRQMNMLCLPADSSGPGMYAFEEDDSDWVNIDRMQAAVLDLERSGLIRVGREQARGDLFKWRISLTPAARGSFSATALCMS